MVGRAIFLACAFAAGPVDACRLALVLAIDVSSSVNQAEDALQRQGLARALSHDTVQDAFLISDDPVALFIFEWSGRYNQKVLFDWAVMQDRDDLNRAARHVAGSQRSHDDSPTALGYALGYAATQFKTAPACLSRTIDVSGDGQNNEGFGPRHAYDAFPFDGVTVNALAVVTENAATDLPAYYTRNVLRGAGAFVEIANGFEDFERAIARKLQRELTSMIIGALGAPHQ